MKIPSNFAWVSKPEREFGSHPHQGFPKPARTPLNSAIGVNAPLDIHTFQSLHFLSAWFLALWFICSQSKIRQSKFTENLGENIKDLGMPRRNTRKTNMALGH